MVNQAEPFKIKMVEKIKQIPKSEREEALKRAGYNLLFIKFRSGLYRSSN